MDVIAKNKKAFYEYFINDTLEAGIALNGDEVKSLREGKVSINEAFAETDKIRELWLINANISSYKNSSKILISDEKEKESYWLRKKILILFKEKSKRRLYYCSHKNIF